MKKQGYKWWRWWVALPCVLVGTIVLMLTLLLILLLDWVKLVEARDVGYPQWFDKLCKWGSNDQ